MFAFLSSLLFVTFLAGAASLFLITLLEFKSRLVCGKASESSTLAKSSKDGSEGNEPGVLILTSVLDKLCPFFY